MPRIRINLDVCNRTAMCYLEHPELFEADDEDYPRLVAGAEKRDLSADEAKAVTEVCPTGALILATHAPPEE